MTIRTFRDKEAFWFYCIEVGICAVVLSLGLSQEDGVWYLNVLVVLIALGFLVAGPPLKAEVVDNKYIVFKGPIRSTRVTGKSLTRVKAMGAYDYRAHISLRNKYGLPVMYRCRKYADAALLAQAILNVVEKAPQAKVSKDALRLLQQTAKGSRKPLPLKQH